MQLCNSGENARSYIGITIFRFSPSSFFSFDFDLIAVIVMSFCVSMPHFTNIGSLTQRYDVLLIFKMTAAAAQF